MSSKIPDQIPVLITAASFDADAKKVVLEMKYISDYLADTVKHEVGKLNEKKAGAFELIQQDGNITITAQNDNLLQLALDVDELMQKKLRIATDAGTLKYDYSTTSQVKELFTQISSAETDRNSKATINFLAGRFQGNLRQ